MEFKKRLNADIPRSVAELQAVMKQFLLKNRLYRILLRGKGLEFEAYRTYSADDDSNTIDWKASKRANNLLVKQYRDERNLKIVFLVDVGENMIFGSTPKLKCEYAAEVVGAFSHLIISTGDKAGLIFFSNEIKEYIRPSGGDRHFHMLIDKITDASLYGGPSNLKKGIDFALDYINKNIDSLVIVSDFIYFNQTLVKSLSCLSNKLETVILMVRDPLDNSLPNVSGEIVVEDSQTGEQILVNPKLAANVYKKSSEQQRELIRKTCVSGNIDLLEINTNEPFVPTLSEFLKGRLKRKEGR